MLRSTFNCEVGLSDHTLGIGAAVAAVAFGAGGPLPTHVAQLVEGALLPEDVLV